MLDELGDALAGERRQPLLGAGRADEARVELLGLGVRGSESSKSTFTLNSSPKSSSSA